MLQFREKNPKLQQ